MQRGLRIVFGTILALCLGAVVGSLSGTMLAMIAKPRGWVPMATRAELLAWSLPGAAIGAVVGIWLGLSRALAVGDPDTEMDEDLDDVEPDKWPKPEAEIL